MHLQELGDSLRVINHQDPLLDHLLYLFLLPICNSTDTADALHRAVSRSNQPTRRRRGPDLGPQPDLPVLILTGFPSVDTAIEALRLGSLQRACHTEETPPAKNTWTVRQSGNLARSAFAMSR